MIAPDFSKYYTSLSSVISNHDNGYCFRFVTYLLVVHIESWHALHPVYAMTVGTASALPLEPNPIVVNVELLL
jgi:hypothetical protein